MTPDELRRNFKEFVDLLRQIFQKYIDLPSGGIGDEQVNIGRLQEIKGNRRCRIKRIGIILVEGENIRYCNLLRPDPGKVIGITQ